MRRARLSIWNRYYDLCESLERDGWFRRPVVPEGCIHNGHLFSVILRDGLSREKLLAHMREAGVVAASHYVPLHDSIAGGIYGRTVGSLAVTESAAANLVRLPLWVGMTERDINRVAEALESALHAA